MDRIESMRIFLRVVEQGSLSAASRQLDIPLATVSRKLAELEEHLRVKLLKRSSRRLELTESGQRYREACRSILEQVDEAERVALGEYSTPRGEVVITAPLLFGRLHVAPVLAAFLRAHREVTARLVLGDRVVSFDEDRIDVAVRIGDLPDSALTGRRIGSTAFCVVASPEYLASARPLVAPEDLMSHPVIAFEGLFSTTTWTFASADKPIHLHLRPTLTANTADAAIAAAEQGLGLTRVLRYQAAAAIRQGRLEEVLRDYCPPELPINLLYAGRALIPMKIRAFIDFATPAIRKSLAG